jgi:hypothetical protein
MAAAFAAVQITQAWEQPTADGYQGIFLEVHNGAAAHVVELAFDIHYLNGQQLLGTDDTCRVAVNIPPGQSARVGCHKQQASAATGVQPRIADVRWQQ